MRTEKDRPAKYLIGIDLSLLTKSCNLIAIGLGPLIRNCEMTVIIPPDSNVEETINSYLQAIFKDNLNGNVKYDFIARYY